MPIIFPPVETASEEGLLAIGGDLQVETLLSAYSQGIFPWPISKDSPLTWFSPDPRGVLFTDKFHASKSLKKTISKSIFEIKFNTNFEQVIQKCGLTERKHETGTWITDEILQGYIRLFHANHAYCVEAYYNHELVGGLYGVIIGKYLSGESMFHTQTNASKVCLYSLIEILKKNKIPLLDTQMVTPIISNFGGELITRSSFLKNIKETLTQNVTRQEIFNVD